MTASTERSEPRRTLVVNLRGGLGNQMFQYACGVAVSSRWGLELSFAADMLSLAATPRTLQLPEVLDAPPPLASPAELAGLIGRWRARPRVRRLLEKPIGRVLRGKAFIVEPAGAWWPGLAEAARAGGYVHGYWQSENYFADAAEPVRRAFRLRDRIAAADRPLAQRIAADSSVAVHIRRGDYLRRGRARATHGVCSPEYYEQALALVRQRRPGARFYAFTDDPAWVRETLLPRHPDMTLGSSDEPRPAVRDLALMSHCRDHIVANSTYSWWAAWLAQDADKLVVAPARWYADARDATHVVPERWLKV